MEVNCSTSCDRTIFKGIEQDTFLSPDYLVVFSQNCSFVVLFDF